MVDPSFAVELGYGVLSRNPPSRVLIVRLSALGDCVHALPALDALRRHLGKTAHIGWMIEEKAASLLTGHPDLDRVHVLPRNALRSLLRAERPISSLGALSTFFREVRGLDYDLTLDFQSNLRSSIAAFASGAHQRVGFARGHDKERSHVWRTHNIAPPAEAVHKVRKNLALIEALGVDTSGARAVLHVPAEFLERASALHAQAFAPDEPVVALHPGVSSFGAFKRWEPARYAELARWLAKHHGARVWITWGPGERELAQEIERRSGPEARAVVAPQTSSILDLAALYTTCRALVGCDTGPVHVAAALGVHVVALYGPKDPAIYAPWGAEGPIAPVWKHVHCSPCRLRWCGNVICMDSIRVDEVGRAVERAILGARVRDELHALR